MNESMARPPRPSDPSCVGDPGADDLTSLLTRRMSRRSGLGALLGGATAIIGGLSGCGIIRLVDPTPPCDLGEPACCNLATCTECAWVGSKDLYTCSEPGHVPTHWTCITETNQVAVCGECNPGPSCFTGPFSCSIWYVT